MENRKIVMPRLGVNDDYVTLTEWLVKEGQEVHKGQKIAVIETTKETSEITAETDGVISLIVAEGNEVEVGKEIALLSDVQSDIIQTVMKKNEVDSLKMTEKAKKLVKEYEIDVSLLPQDKLIKEKDVLALVGQRSKDAEVSPDTNMKAIDTTPVLEIKSNSILVYGAGGTGKEIIDYLSATHAYEIYGIIDRQYPDLKEVFGVPVVGTIDDLDKFREMGISKIINAIAFQNRAHYRKEIYEILKSKGFEFVNIIHRTASIEPSVKLGLCNIICAGTIISSGARIGNNCLINNGSIISHDCDLGDHCHIASGAILAGYVTVGENTLIGQNCTVNVGVKIGKNVVIQNGCHIFKDVRDNEVVLLS